MTASRSTRTRIGYGCGSLVTGAYTTLPGLLLLPYLTDTLGAGAVLAGAVVLVPKAWAVVLAPAAGRAADRSGARRTHFLLGGLAAAAGLGLMLSGPAAGGAGVAWTALGFLLTATAFAFFQAAFAALPAELADRPEDRMRLVGSRVAGIAVAALLVGAAAPALVEANGEACPATAGPPSSAPRSWPWGPWRSTSPPNPTRPSHRPHRPPHRLCRFPHRRGRPGHQPGRLPRRPRRPPHRSRPFPRRPRRAPCPPALSPPRAQRSVGFPNCCAATAASPLSSPAPPCK
ncbi:MFS transporter [Streptomyces nojiriensis]